ncbi:MAG: hypothetical protein KGJ84_07880 [Elusimicrobia bacterium]|nr:hypothetical protein [Elusimicrobiota bacterium]
MRRWRLPLALLLPLTAAAPGWAALARVELPASADARPPAPIVRDARGRPSAVLTLKTAAAGSAAATTIGFWTTRPTCSAPSTARPAANACS